MTPPSTHTRASKLRNTVVRFPQPVCSLVTRHQRLAAAATSISGRQSVVEWPINHDPNVLNRSQLDGTESFLVFPHAIFWAVWKTGYVSVFFLPLFRLIFLPTETLWGEGCGPLSYSLDSMPPSWTGIHMYGYIHQSMFVPTWFNYRTSDNRAKYRSKIGSQTKKWHLREVRAFLHWKVIEKWPFFTI